MRQWLILYNHVPRPPQFPGLMKTDVTEDDSHRTDSKDTKSESCPEAASAEPSSPTKVI